MHRRSFLQFVAGSPLLAASPTLGQLVRQDELPIIQSPEDALNVFEFEAAARSVMPPAHFGYMATGSDDDTTLRANRQGFSHYQLRPRRLVDVSNVDMTSELLGIPLEAPILIHPVGGQRMFHPDGELATARAARSRNTVQVLSTASSTSIEEVTDARGAPVFFQLYARTDWDATLALVRRAEATGCQVLVWTVDLIGGRNLETLLRFRRLDTGDCESCHGNDPTLRQRNRNAPAPFTWEFLRRLKDATPMKVMIKGIDTYEDALLAVENGADGIVVSNHGGRAADTGRGTIEALPEVIEAVAGRIPVVVDGGIRRGTDIFKALALGAHAVGIGRPYVWGLASFGQSGVETVVDILRSELRLTMQQSGTRSISEITANRVTRSSGIPLFR